MKLGDKLLSIKQKIKKYSFLVKVNRLIQSLRLKTRYWVISRHYDYLKPTVSLRVFPKLNASRLNILFMGTDEQQDTSGLLQALQSFGEVTVFTRADGSYGQSPAKSLTSLNAYDVNTQRLLAIVAQMEGRGEPPNLIIGQMWGVAFDAAVLDNTRQKNATVVMNIAMDDRHTYWGDMKTRRWMGSYGMIPHIDIALTAAPECVQWYLKEGCPAIFFPEASDSNIFYPMPELPKIYDVSFVGARYGIREKIVQALRSAGVSVSAFGNDWEGGRLPTQEVPRLFAQSKIILGIGTIGHCNDFYALKLRDFDAPMSGSFYLTNDNPDLKDLYEIGREIETYSDIADCVEKVKWYLAHDDEREYIASAGRQRALKDHTWSRRFSDLFTSLRAN